MDAVGEGEGSEVEHVGGQEPEEGGTFQHGGNPRLRVGFFLAPPRPSPFLPGLRPGARDAAAPRWQGRSPCGKRRNGGAPSGGGTGAGHTTNRDAV
ncbi:hypothetical protein GCM10020221_35100 [Streptomyces thioluteus]|uniref:Uncharacterized protein n=1 Tax=Streptomyces thioluteus TaxID=66431 RepID=A0ABN3X3E4_STRTU